MKYNELNNHGKYSVRNILDVLMQDMHILCQRTTVHEANQNILNGRMYTFEIDNDGGARLRSCVEDYKSVFVCNPHTSIAYMQVNQDNTIDIYVSPDNLKMWANNEN